MSLIIPQATFFLFGAGARRKLLYRAGRLLDALTGEVLFAQEATQEVVDAPAYTVRFTTSDEKPAVIREDERGVWLDYDGETHCLTAAPVHLPMFEGHPYAQTLRVLHHEILVNVMPHGPVPNFLVYPKPWHRDAAMTAMVFQRTGNLPLIHEWIAELRTPFDGNNGGQCEPDNLGQALYLISLVSDRSHPLIADILAAIPSFVRDDHGRGSYICGATDFAEHPVYQTQWLKFGLRALGLDDPFVTPWLEDSYATLCWWAEHADYIGRPKGYHTNAEYYPYLAWAEAHFFKTIPDSLYQAPLHLTGRNYPLTWEAHASQAYYGGMRLVDEAFVAQQLCAPHSWHAAEMFLYLHDLS
ncbi:MAG TPA: hypothetical protein PKH77_15985 [Anaerolineae bacterium]|nr:hypothetical protein [Anaerolineae bacterium]